MANIENLKPITSKEIARELGSKGGKQKAINDKKRKTLKEELLALLSIGDMQKKISLALIGAALSGDVQAFKAIEASIGEKQVERQEVANSGEIKIIMSDEIKEWGK